MKDVVTREKEFYERNTKIFKSNDMIQKSRHDLSIEEQRIVLYLISKIKPEDTEFTSYTFSIKEFYSLCGISNNSYGKLKQIIKDLRDKSWWITLEDEKGEYETTVSWVDKPTLRQQSDEVTLKLDKDLIPYLLELKNRFEDDGVFYTSYYLKHVLPMKSKYGIRLYEVLKSYSFNKDSWYFDVDELRLYMNCAKINKKTRQIEPTEYEKFGNFKQRVIVPAVNDINKYTDIKIDVEYIRQGYPVKWVNFILKEKGNKELIETDVEVERELDGQIDYMDFIKEMKKKQG